MTLQYSIGSIRRDYLISECDLKESVTFALPNEQYLKYDFVAQLVEQQTLNLWVRGSIPRGVTFFSPIRISLCSAN